MRDIFSKFLQQNSCHDFSFAFLYIKHFCKWVFSKRKEFTTCRKFFIPLQKQGQNIFDWAASTASVSSPLNVSVSDKQNAV